MIWQESLEVMPSLPSRERGLKFFYGEHGEQVEPSLPSRERGLKFTIHILIL